MEDNVRTKRGLFIALVLGTMLIFVGLVWLIARNVPWEMFNDPIPSYTAVALRLEKNCTNPVSYWMDHPELYPPVLVLGNEAYQAKEITEMLFDEGASLDSQLQAQLVGAFLNVLSGSDRVPIESTIFKAYDWLVQHPDGSEISPGEVEAGTRLSDALKSYNLGRSGVAPCQSGLLLETAENGTAAIMTSYPPTLTNGQTGTVLPTSSPTLALQTITPLQTLTFPTRTPSPTTEEAEEPLPTNTFAVEPTNTPKKTTAAPAPTNTPVNTTAAPPTWTNTPVPPSPTLPPEPTSTPTFPTIPN